MARTRYWGRYKRGRKWGETWHFLKGANSRDEALGKLLKGTLYNFTEVQITTKEPAVYAGKYPRNS
jgi:hypothetical protein